MLKGTSGIQAGTSAPGGLVNYVVKRPTEQDLRQVKLEAGSRANLLAAADLGGRFGEDAFGYRLNACAGAPAPPRARSRRRAQPRRTGHRLARRPAIRCWKANSSGAASPSPARSASACWATRCRARPIRASISTTNPGREPRSSTPSRASLRFTQALTGDWRWSAQLGTQRLKSDDFTAFPFGCGAEGNFDRFCSDGTFDFYDFRSENERRRQDAASLNLKGKLATGGVSHDLSLGLLAGKLRNRFQPQAFNFVGTGNVDGTAVVPEDPTTATVVSDRDERSLELFAADAIRWNERLTTWVGLRHTRLDRGYDQSINTPWLAVSYKLGADIAAYASYGEAVESQQVPNNPLVYSNPGEVLPALKSKQLELGFKGGNESLGWQMALFQIKRPLTNIDFCSRTFSTCTGQSDGQALHRGVEGSAIWAQGPWRVGGSLMLLDAQRQESSLEPANNGKQPPNVPDVVARAHAAWGFASVPGLELLGSLSHEGRRAVLADESVMLPSWTRLDAALRYETKLGGSTGGMDRGHRQRHQQAPLERIALPVRPCLPLPRRAADLSRSANCRALRKRKK